MTLRLFACQTVFCASAGYFLKAVCNDIYTIDKEVDLTYRKDDIVVKLGKFQCGFQLFAAFAFFFHYFIYMAEVKKYQKFIAVRFYL